MRRRKFIGYAGWGMAGSLLSDPFGGYAKGESWWRIPSGGEHASDIVIVGGGLGGCAAAMAACSHGATVILTEPTDWIGGQITQQGVPPDEHQWIESFGRPASYARFRTLVRDYYRHHYPLNQRSLDNPYLNPGNGTVSRLCHEPHVAKAVLEAMLAPEVSRGRLKILLNTQPDKAFVLNDRIQALQCHQQGREEALVLKGNMFIDASEEGDLLALAGAEYVIGAESKEQTGEAHAPDKQKPDNIQSITWCFAMDYMEGETHTIDKPRMYDFWKEYVPELNPPWPGRLLSLHYSRPRDLQPASLSFIPPGTDGILPETSSLNLWTYRRLIDRNNFLPGHYSSDITLVNWPQNDFMPGNITNVKEEVREKNMFQAKQLSLSLLYWLQTEAPRPDGGQGWPGLRLRRDILGTEDGLAKFPYIRESRRIVSEYTILEQDISMLDREKENPSGDGPVLGRNYPDTVGVGYYALDLHPSTGGDNYIDMESVPFQIPLGALIPVRMDNLVPGCKNIGTTHITNGCYRLHPVEWTIGEVAGHLCATSLRKNIPPRGIRNDVKHLQEFQSLLMKAGVELDWSALM